MVGFFKWNPMFYYTENMLVSWGSLYRTVHRGHASRQPWVHKRSNQEQNRPVGTIYHEHAQEIIVFEATVHYPSTLIVYSQKVSNSAKQVQKRSHSSLSNFLFQYQHKHNVQNMKGNFKFMNSLTEQGGTWAKAKQWSLQHINCWHPTFLWLECINSVWQTYLLTCTTT